MGNQKSKNIPSLSMNRGMGLSCTDDQMCQNIDSKRSKVDKLVYVCPGAKCVYGTCNCGAKCKRDPTSGMCCSEVEEQVINGEINTFCIEKPYNVENYCNLKN